MRKSARKLAREGLKNFAGVFGKSKKTKDLPKGNVPFDQWRIIFVEVCGYDIKTPSSKIKRLGEFYGVKRDPNPASLLFAVHGYYALLMKFLAAEIVTLSLFKNVSGYSFASYERELKTDVDLEALKEFTEYFFNIIIGRFRRRMGY